MNKQLFSLICLTLLATTLPSCRNRKKEATAQKEEINTMIELDALTEERIRGIAREEIVKFYVEIASKYEKAKA